MIESEILFTDLLGCDRVSLYLNQDRYLNKQQADFLASVLKRRAKGEPLQYILAKTEFMGLQFRLTEDVLIPRPETEILVETALRYFSNIDTALQILDLGTGSGCIAICLAKVLSNSIIDAIDISERALKVAKKNSRLHKVNINFMPSDLFSNQKLIGNSYDLIISNPPYIPGEEIKNLQPEIRFEPDIALDGGSDGLDFYRRVIGESSQYLKDRGLLMIEIGFNQKYAVQDIIGKSSALDIIEIVKDYHNFERVIVAQKR
ncbi:peptide chain release factor N(5)-glutamine methyltransferase [bacterium]|nr:MAG: peptide chain release factor N(5)-glutamine methyltransferase [bacterium]